MSKSSIAAVALVLIMVASAFTVATANVSANKGARDSYGYAWTDSKSPAPSVAFNWVEINSTGTLSGVDGDDYCTGPFPIGFNFTFYGNTYRAFNISTNGYIVFGNSYDDLSADTIPSSWGLNNFIALYWHDMYVDGSAGHGIYYQTMGVAPNRQLVVEYLNFSDLSSTYTHMTLEIILFENGQIWMQYLTLNGMTGSNAGVGIENSDGSIGTQYSHDTASLVDGLAIMYSVSPVIIGPSATKTAPPGDVLTYALSVTNKMAIADSFAIECIGVEGWSVNVYDASWNVLADTDADGLPDTGSVGAGASATIHVNVTVADPFVNPIEYTTMNASAHSNSSLYDVCVLTSQVSDAWFEPPHVSSVSDPNGNGDYDTLDLNATLYVRVTGWYYMYGYLYTASDYYVGSDYVSAYYTAGTHYAMFHWMGWLIRNLGDDGQLRVNLEVFNSAWTLLDTDTHTTAYYAATQFMPNPAVLQPPHYDSPLDTDSDGLYEYLILHTNVTVSLDGTFRIRAYMYDEDSHYMFMNSTDLTLTAGAHTVDIWFDSETMRTSSAVGAPYDFYIYLYAYISGEWWDIGSGSHTTQAYSDALFQAPDAFFQDPHSDTPVDTNSDGYYEWLYIDVGVNVTVAGEYTITGDLSVWSYVGTESNNSYFDVGYHSVRLAYPGWPIRYNDDSYYIDVDLTLTGSAGIVDTDSFRTSTYYRYYDFALAPGWFVGTYECGVEDVNGDGYYDYLLANVTVNVTADGIYEVHADLRNWWGGTICDLTDRQYLAAGEHVYYFAFPGWMIRADGYDPDEVYLYLYDEDSREMDTYYFYAPSYSYLDFQTLPAYIEATGNAIHPQDNDSDGVNDTMVMVVNVTVDTPGSYYVMGSLVDWYGNTVGTQRVLASLAAGNSLVTITFPGWLIHALAVNGTYGCNAYLYDAAMHQIDNVYFSGGYWYNDFDGTVPRMTSTWAPNPPSVDGILAAGEWTSATIVDMTASDSMNRVGAKLMVMNNATHLFIAFDAYGDTSEDADDLSALAFDTDNDDVATYGREDEFTIYASGSQRHYTSNGVTSWLTHCTPFDTASENHTGLASAAGFGNSPAFAYHHRVFEYSIPLALLNATMYDVLGFMTASHSLDGLEDYHNYTWSAWPLLVSDNELSTYGELVLATHVLIPPPVTTHALAGTLGDSSWYRTAVTVTLSATGGDGGVDHTEYSLDNGAWSGYAGPIVIATNGTHSLRYRSTDAAAQEEAIKTVAVNIDQVVPLTVSGISGSWVWLNATDGHSGVGIIMYRIDGVLWMEYAGPFNVTGTKGMHTVEYYARDGAGNSETMKSIEVEVTVGTGGGLSGLLSNPILWIGLIAAIGVVLVLVVLVMKRRKGQQPVMYMGPGQPMPPQPWPMPEMPPPPGPLAP